MARLRVQGSQARSLRLKAKSRGLRARGWGIAYPPAGADGWGSRPELPALSDWPAPDHDQAPYHSAPVRSEPCERESWAQVCWNCGRVRVRAGVWRCTCAALHVAVRGPGPG